MTVGVAPDGVPAAGVLPGAGMVGLPAGAPVVGEPVDELDGGVLELLPGTSAGLSAAVGAGVLCAAEPPPPQADNAAMATNAQARIALCLRDACAIGVGDINDKNMI